MTYVQLEPKSSHRRSTRTRTHLKSIAQPNHPQRHCGHWIMWAQPVMPSFTFFQSCRTCNANSAAPWHTLPSVHIQCLLKESQPENLAEDSAENSALTCFSAGREVKATPKKRASPNAMDLPHNDKCLDSVKILMLMDPLLHPISFKKSLPHSKRRQRIKRSFQFRIIGVNCAQAGKLIGWRWVRSDDLFVLLLALIKHLAT